MQLKRIVIVAGAISSIGLSSANADIDVVTSIKPVHSLVSGVMEGVGTPSVILSLIHI